MRPRTLFAAAVALGSLFAAEAAFAYILPADFIVRMLAQKRAHMKIRDMSIQLTLEREGSDALIEERLYLKSPERLRQVRQEEDASVVYVSREGRSAQGPENALRRVSGAPADLLPVLLMPRGDGDDEQQSRILSALAARGINTHVVSLARFQGSIAYVIGARPHETERPQIWIDKETFQPLRLILPNRDGGGTVETRWLEFGSSVTGDWFPRVIEVYRDGKRVERAEVQKIELNEQIPETLFQLP